MESTVTTPKPIVLDSLLIDICFHPTRNVIAAGDIDGQVTIHSYSTTDDNQLLLSFNHHKKSCRAVCFQSDGIYLISVSKDRSIQVIDLDKATVKQVIRDAHKSAIYCCLVIDNNIIATGDDDGVLKLWDMRYNRVVMELQENEQFISDMIVDSHHRLLLATSGEGTLTAFDIRKHKLKVQSELFDSELLSLCAVKKESKLVCGAGDGVLNIFNWNQWGNISDRITGEAMSVDCILSLTENIVCTGSFDGAIRAVHILPNKQLGVVGNHGDFPVENLSLSHCGQWLASCSHDQTIRFWNSDKIRNTPVNAHQKNTKATAAANDFFNDLSTERDNESD